MLSLLANIAIHLHKSKETDYKMYRYSYMLSMFQWAKKITKVEIEELKEYYIPVQKSIKTFNHFNIRVSDLFPDFLKDYLKMFFLSDVILVERISKAILSKTEDLIQIYQFVGAMDYVLVLLTI